MKAGVVLRLLVAAICSWLGVHLWRGDSRVLAAEGVASDGGAARPAADSSATSSARAAQSRSSPNGTERRFEDSAESSEAGRSSDGSAPAARSGPSSRVHHAPRADPSAIAPLPPVVGPTAPHVPEALARVALRFVGRDAAADALWRDAIDDLGLSKQARSDLIEDLNDEGYPDRDHLTAADLPLIMERIRIVERLAPRAIDDVNGAAFEEAYKDLVDMYVRLR